jgi:hypothetical protein
MTYRSKKDEGKTGNVCEQSIETLREYKRKGIPLMPHQQACLDEYYKQFRSRQADA